MLLNFWPPLPDPGPQPIDPIFRLKVLLKTSSKSAPVEPLIDLLAYLQPKLWVKPPVFGQIKNVSEKAQFALSGQSLASHNSAAD